MKIHPAFEMLLTCIGDQKHYISAWNDWVKAGKPVVDAPESHLYGYSSDYVHDLQNRLAEKDARIKELEQQLADTTKGWAVMHLVPSEIRNEALESVAQYIERASKVSSGATQVAWNIDALVEEIRSMKA